MRESDCYELVRLSLNGECTTLLSLYPLTRFMLCVTMLIVVCGACLIKAMTVYIVLPVSAKAKERYYHIGGIDNKEKILVLLSPRS